MKDTYSSARISRKGQRYFRKPIVSSFAKRWFLVLGFFMIVSVMSWSEAQVLPSGTIIALPDGTVKTVGEAMFLLPRLDMESATLALETVKIREDEIVALRNQSIFNYALAAIVGALLGSVTVLVATHK